ncbi:hypothetical protein GN244_ATG04630 [Phytophthora infestans]|uniref:M96 mating-specific protein family n=1 Tax=Phytophthora infestans TaxID=4787 RepID=A0A833TM90_PHYIN|nr:hypothetical protein GN244_ATG04630 [Phytophthora infestans]
MSSTDAAFLAEVEHFLASCDQPQYEASNEHHQIPCTKHQHEDLEQLDAASRRELEKAKDRKRRRMYREQRRTERDNLQQEIERLTEQLQTAQGETKLTPQLTIPFWKKVAQRQLAAREDAELRQQQLFQAIGFYSNVLEESQRLFYKRLHHLNDFPDDEKLRIETADADIFALYIKNLDAVYARTDKTLQACRLESTEANWNTPFEIWDKDSKTGYFQFRGKIILPFDFQDICRSRWQNLRQQDYQESYDAVANSEDTLARRVRRTIHLTSGGIASILWRLVIRRYEADGRMVLVWRMLTEGEGMFAGMHADETGWGVATAVEGSKPGTVLRTCVRNAPMHFSNTAARNDVVKQFGDELFEWGRENHEEATTGLERLLLTNV